MTDNKLIALLRTKMTDAMTRALRRRLLLLFSDGPVSFERCCEVAAEELLRLDLGFQEEGYISRTKISFDVKL